LLVVEWGGGGGEGWVREVKGVVVEWVGGVGGRKRRGGAGYGKGTE